MNRSRLIQRFTMPFLLGLFSVSCVEKNMSDDEKRQRVEGMIAEIEAEFPVPQIDVATAKRSLTKQGFLLIDVREPKEIEVSTIPGSITQRQFEANPAAYKNKEIVAYCTIGYRSSKFAMDWNQQGFHISNLRGSLLLWTYANGPLADSEGKPTHQMHVYGRKWDLLPTGYQSIY